MEQKLQTRIFKGLYSDVDRADLGEGYFHSFKNIRVRPGYIESEGIVKDNRVQLNENERYVFRKIVLLDEDKLSNYSYPPNPIGNRVFFKTLHSNYIQNLQYKALQCIYSLVAKTFTFTLDNLSVSGLTLTGGFEIPKVINENGVVKLFFSFGSYQISKLSRTLRKYQSANRSAIDEGIRKEGYCLTKLIENYTESVKPVNFKAVPKVITEDLYHFDKIKKVNTGETTYFWKSPDDDRPIGRSTAIRYELYDTYDQLFETRVNTSNNSAVWSSSIFFHRTFESVNGGNWKYWVTADTLDHLFNELGTTVWEALGLTQQFHGILYFEDGFTMQSPGGFLLSLTQFDAFKELELYAKQTFNEETGIDKNAAKVELLATVMLDNLDEYIVQVQEFKVKENYSKNFILEVEVDVDFSLLNDRATRVNLFARTNKDDDFEQFQIIDFISKEKFVNKIYLDETKYTGLLLSQAIGASYQKEDFKIIHNPDDYISINGIYFAVKNGNIYHSAIGRGAILNSFYPSNIVPSVEAGKLINVNGSLGAISLKKELVTFIESQYTEGQVLFYIKGVTGFKVRNTTDVIETPDGVAIHTKDGIFALNGIEKVELSREIKDEVEKGYNSGKIFYDSFNKYLLYLNDNKCFRYSFEANCWDEQDLKINLSDVISIEDNFDGSMTVIQTDTSYKLTLSQSVLSFIKSGLEGIDSPNLKKRINRFEFDFQGTLIFGGKTYQNANRAITRIEVPLRKRVPLDLFEYEASFQGKLYSVTIFYELTTWRKN